MPFIDLRSQAAERTPDEMIEHLESFELDLKFSAGIWFFSPFESRFHAKYKQDIPLEARLEIAASLKEYGLAGLEAQHLRVLVDGKVDVDLVEIGQLGIDVALVASQRQV